MGDLTTVASSDFARELHTDLSYEPKEVILTCQMADEHQISDLYLQPTRVSAIDESGKEFDLLHFKEKAFMKLLSLETGTHFKTRSLFKLPAGTYKKFRFYLMADQSMFQSINGSIIRMEVDHLDFDMQGGLSISDNCTEELVMRFDIPVGAEKPGMSLIDSLKDIFRFKSNKKLKVQSA